MHISRHLRFRPLPRLNNSLKDALSTGCPLQCPLLEYYQERNECSFSFFASVRRTRCLPTLRGDPRHKPNGTVFHVKALTHKSKPPTFLWLEASFTPLLLLRFHHTMAVLLFLTNVVFLHYVLYFLIFCRFPTRLPCFSKLF